MAYYNFNGANLNDSSGHNNQIVFNNAVATEDRNGIANNAYLFNGSSSYMRVTNSGSLNPNQITLSAIVKVNGFYIASCSENQILGKGYPDDVDGFYHIRFVDTLNLCSSTPNINHEVFTAGFGDDIPQGADAGAIAPLNISTGTWYSVIYTYDGQYSRLYINGQLKDIRQKAVPFTPNNHDLYIGKHEDPTFPYYFNGVIDEIRIYDRALCGSAVQTLYSHGLN
ncbi:MAG: LamG domain-containing protein [Chitinophagales bacterium]